MRVMGQRVAALISAISLALVASCRNTAGIESVEYFVTPCYGAVAVSVSSDPQPLITWSPQCGVSSVYVATVPTTPGALEIAMWWFSVPEQLPVGSGVRYGQAPARATSSLAQPLVAGERYRVRVMQTVGLDVSVAEGVALFTR
jgi:hypothetical protein